MKIASFMPLSGSKTVKTITSNQIDSSGYSTTTKSYTKYYEVKPDFFKFDEMRSELPVVYYLHHFLGVVCPFLLIGQAEVSTVIAIAIVTIYL